jgi:hypothetical protein
MAGPSASRLGPRSKHASEDGTAAISAEGLRSLARFVGGAWAFVGPNQGLITPTPGRSVGRAFSVHLPER